MNADSDPKVIHLVYHYVKEDHPSPWFNCRPSRLRAQIEYLRNRGYTFLTCREIAKRISQDKPLPKKTANLSFDDGLKSHVTTVFPMLMELGVQATFFCNSCTLIGKLTPTMGLQILLIRLGPTRLQYEILPKVLAGTPYADLLEPKLFDIGKRRPGEPPDARRIKVVMNDMLPPDLKREKIDDIFADYLGASCQSRIVTEWNLTSNEMRRMAESGMEIGAHTVSHNAIETLSRAQVRDELLMSRTAIQETIDQPVESMAWPFVATCSSAVRLIAQSAYSSAWNFLPFVHRMPDNAYADLWSIARLHEQDAFPDMPL